MSGPISEYVSGTAVSTAGPGGDKACSAATTRAAKARKSWSKGRNAASIFCSLVATLAANSPSATVDKASSAGAARRLWMAWSIQRPIGMPVA